MPQFKKISHSDRTDILFHYGTFSLPDEEIGDSYRRMLSYGEGILLYYRTIGAFLIEDGGCVTIRNLPDSIGEELIQAILMGPALGMILYQRCRYMVFHAGAVAKDDGLGALSFMAVKGGGKSTMTGSLLNHGFSLVSDDLMAIRKEEEQVLVQPGFPGMKLWDHSVVHLGYRAEDFPMLGKDGCYEKRFLPVRDRFIESEIPLHTVFILEYSEDEKVEILPLTKKEALMHCLLHWYGANFHGQLLPVLGVERHFRECSFLADNVRICRLIRPRRFDRIEESVEAVEKWRKEQTLG